ncbi:SCN10A [Symbiodinium sp. CCMP2592]|nr:SCN10A [Symbiodinium sp. CCMP2592]
MAPEVKPHPFRIFVSGLSKTHVQRYDGSGIVEEDNLGYFFYDRGCKVEDVRLMVDPSTSKCRGFGFVDFTDEESFGKALALAGTQDPEGVKLDPASHGQLKVEAAKPAQPVARDKHQELAKARDQTEDMERALRWREANVRELEAELHKHRERQKLMDAQRTVEVRLAEERQRQDELRLAEEKLAAVEEALRAALTSEQERTRALEAIAHTVDEEHRRPDPHGAEEVGDASEEEAQEGPGLELRIKNTFIEFCVPKEHEHLVRTRTAPSMVSQMGDTSAPSPTDGYMEEGGATSSSQRTSPLLTMVPAPSPPAPWALKRDSSSILRSILEDKMEAESERDAAESRGRSASQQAKGRQRSIEKAEAPAAEAAAEDAAREQRTGALSMPSDHITSWADESENLETGTADPWSAPESDGRREVRLRNLPLRPAEELKEHIYKELARLWRVVLNRSEPAVESMSIADHQDESVASSLARATGTEATIVFERPQDAKWLVDIRQPPNWTSAQTMSIRGRVLQSEWPPLPPPVDWRRLRYKADTDASSQVSYDTVGTRRSCSHAIQARRPGEAPAVRKGDDHPPQNRTVILTGIAHHLPVHTVRAEILDLLRRLWNRDGLKFDPETQLHRGAEGGLTVRHSRRPGQENDGSCVVRLRNYCDAKWLVEQARGLSIEGRPLRAMWARPRDGGR